MYIYIYFFFLGINNMDLMEENIPPQVSTLLFSAGLPI